MKKLIASAEQVSQKKTRVDGLVQEALRFVGEIESADGITEGKKRAALLSSLRKKLSEL
jgi:hypothetical protein